MKKFELGKSKREGGVNRMKKLLNLILIVTLIFVSSSAFAETRVDGGKGMVDVSDISKGTQTNDVKVTLDGEAVILGAGSANIGDVDVLTLPTLPAGTNNIGDVDVLTLPALAAGTAEIGKVEISDGVEQAAVNASLQLEVNVNTATGLEVIQSTAADLNVTEASASAIKTAVELIDNAITGTEMQVDVVAPLPAGTNNIGDVDVLTLPALVAGTANIGDVDVLTLPALSAGSALIGKVNIDATLVTKTSTQDLSVGALAYITNFAADTEIKQVMLHADAAMTQTITVTFDSTTGATYDTVLDKTSVTSATDYLWQPDHSFVVASGDEMLVGCTNTGTPAVNVYVSVLGETID